MIIPMIPARCSLFE